MIARQILRDLGTLAVAALAIVVLIAVAGALAALFLLFVVIPLGWGLVLVVTGLARVLDATDDYCAQIDQELDQELAARRALRVQRTVQAEPAAAVVDIFSREPVA